MGEPVDCSGFELLFDSSINAFSDIQVDVEFTVEEGDKVGALIKFNAFHKKSERPVKFDVMVFGRIVDDIMVEAWNCVDFMALAIQTGDVAENIPGKLIPTA